MHLSIFPSFLTLSCCVVGISKGHHNHPEAERTPEVREPGAEYDISLLNFTRSGNTSINSKTNVNSSLEKYAYNVDLKDHNIKNSDHYGILDLSAKTPLDIASWGADLVAGNNSTNYPVGRPEPTRPMKCCHSHSEKFISEEKRHSGVTRGRSTENSTGSETRKSVAPQRQGNSGRKEAGPEVAPLEGDSFAHSYLTVENNLVEDEKLGARGNFKPRNLSLGSLNSDNANADSKISSESDDNDQETSWLDVITSPFAKKALKYLVTEFYPKKILNTVTKRWKPSNSTNNTVSVDVSPSVVYPLLMEGVSILVNRLTDDDSTSTSSNEPDPAIKGKIIGGVIESLNKLLKSNGPENPISAKIDHVVETHDDIIFNPNTLNELLPLVENIPRGDLQNTINSLMGMISANSTLPSISNADLTRILSQPKVLSMILQNGRSFGGLSGLRNTTALSEILKKPNFLNALLGKRPNSSDSGNLTNVMDRFLPGKVAGQGMSPKNPLLRSDFASKVLAKSPIAHLGALDESIKRLITDSLEKAVSRVKINEKGEIQMSEGMRKALGKMMVDESTGQNRTSDSLMDLLKSAIASGSVKVEHSDSTDDGKPVVRRNVTHHSHLHRRFQEKYGKYYQKSSVEALSCSLFVLFVLPTITIVST